MYFFHEFKISFVRAIPQATAIDHKVQRGLMIFFFLVVAIICAVVGAKIASSKGRDPAVWGLVCFFTGLIGIIILLVTADASPPQRTISYTPNTPTPPEPRTRSGGSTGSAAKGYDEKKWNALKEVDPEIREAANTVRALGSTHEDELAEKYLILSDKAYLPALVEKITTAFTEKTAREAERASAAKAGGAELLESYQASLKENYGRDPETHKQVKRVSLYTGLAQAYVGGLQIVFADGTVSLRNGRARMQFKTEQDAEDWG